MQKWKADPLLTTKVVFYSGIGILFLLQVKILWDLLPDLVADTLIHGFW